MHQVYDDKMTFKLVQAASSVSGLPIETCLEEFGKHFLVYCQKNGYDQILRVLGSNLYDFLTNLDNLHDHLASIYPGMRAPSFRVTRHMNTNRNHRDAHRSSAACGSLSGSMYLHYYSERVGLSPIVKGLVMAVAREFFHTEISVSEIDSDWAHKEQTAQDDHVVLKIDRRPSESQQSPAPSGDHQATEQRRQSTTGDQVGTESSPMVSIYDSLSTNPQDSMVNSEIMMQTFPFHVIFDRRFKIVQVGNSLLRATSLFWRTRCLSQTSLSAADQAQSQICFGDLFNIIRPKIDFTFDAIADHTNQVFVVKTRPQVLNADFLRSQSFGCSGSQKSSPINQANPATSGPSAGARCPLDRIAEQRRQAAGQADSAKGEQGQPVVEERAQVEVHPLDAPGEPQHLGLRLKGQMIILLGGELCLYLCSPRVDDLDQLLECGVNMADFALHDRARELMLMSHTHKEDRETVKKLDQASNDLKKMDTKLRLENKRTNEVLHNIFPAKIATLLSHGLKVESESFESVTCLYSDIIGFTKMCGSENVRPIDIVRLLNTLYLQFDNLTNIHGVFKVETIGDAYVVVGGLPEPVEDHADRCVRMGLDMVKVIGTVRSPADGNPIQMRIGIHSGPVMAGIVGIRVPRYSLFGNTTTLANQLETNGVGGKIHISDLTLKSLIERDRFVVEDNPSQISGIPFVTYFVTNYMGDKNETLKHERLLEEQLIKDLELMGSELELVDDSSRPDVPFRVPDSAGQAGAGGASAPAALQLHSGAVQSLSEALAGDTDLLDVRQSLLMDIEDQRLAELAQCAPSHQRSGRQRHRPHQRLDQEDAPEAPQAGPEQEMQPHYLQQMSAHLSGAIIDEAIKRSAHLSRPEPPVAPARSSRAGTTRRGQLSTRSAENLLALLVSRQAQLKLILSPPADSEPGSALDARRPTQASCPVCAGSGELQDSKTIQLHVALAEPGTVSAPLKTSGALASSPRQDSDESRFGLPCGPCDGQSWCDERSPSSPANRTPEASTLGKSDLSTDRLTRSTAGSLERLLAELRDERRYLEAQIERLARIPVASKAKEPAPVLVQPQHQQQSVLSAGLNRMKRMDTLKLRRLKRIQEQQRGSGTELGLASSGVGLPQRPIHELPSEEELEQASPERAQQPVAASSTSRSLSSAPEVRPACAQQSPQRHPEGPSGYQALRASIASLLADAHGATSKRKSCFSLSSFQLPFGSPQRPRNNSPTNEHSPGIEQLTDSEPTSTSKQRRTSSGRFSSKRATSCLCLRSSSSSQSVSDSVSAQVR